MKSLRNMNILDAAGMRAGAGERAGAVGERAGAAGERAISRSDFSRIASAVMALLVTALLVFGNGTAWAANKDADSSRSDAKNMVNPQQLPDSSFIYDTSIYELNNSDTYYANQTVQITGEVVGDRIRSENDRKKCWITVSAIGDDLPATIQVYLSKTDAKGIDTYGQYGKVGSTVTVKGTYNLVCAEHDGLSDIHAETFTVTEPGHVIESQFNPSDFITGIILVIAGLFLVIYYKKTRDRMR